MSQSIHEKLEFERAGGGSPELVEGASTDPARAGGFRRLSSHFRLSAAGEQAASLAVSERLKARIHDLNADSAESARPTIGVGEAVGALLERMRSLAATGAFEG